VRRIRTRSAVGGHEKLPGVNPGAGVGRPGPQADDTLKDRGEDPCSLYYGGVGSSKAFPPQAYCRYEDGSTRDLATGAQFVFWVCFAISRRCCRSACGRLYGTREHWCVLAARPDRGRLRRESGPGPHRHPGRPRCNRRTARPGPTPRPVPWRACVGQRCNSCGRVPGWAASASSSSPTPTTTRSLGPAGRRGCARAVNILEAAAAPK
jgi:hypothetical protein